MKMLIFHCFYKVLAPPAGGARTFVFLVFLMIFYGECAVLHADSEYYGASIDICNSSLVDLLEPDCASQGAS